MKRIAKIAVVMGLVGTIIYLGATYNVVVANEGKQHCEYEYHMDRIEGEYAVIEVTDKTCDTITMVDVKINR